MREFVSLVMLQHSLAAARRLLSDSGAMVQSCNLKKEYEIFVELEEADDAKDALTLQVIYISHQYRCCHQSINESSFF